MFTQLVSTRNLEGQSHVGTLIKHERWFDIPALSWHKLKSELHHGGNNSELLALRIES
jgi:hypothetical protein